ncbi:MAG TPA: APC family permease [Mycobacterium sp.]|nr:APC family permease [Mycobacterium sp.]
MTSRTDAETPGSDADHPNLKRVMGPGLLLLFVVGDILGTGVYALTGDVAAEVGGAAWVPFLVAFLIAAVTACSYLELVTKYPQAAGAALYTHKAFGVHFVTFLVAFIVMCSGITSASTASRFFAANFFTAFHFSWGKAGVVVVALLFMALLAVINFRGVGESVKLNVVLTIIEITGLLLVIFVGLWAFTKGGENVDFSRVVAFDTPADKNVFLAVTTATSLAFFAMVGFEDSVNMAEETKDPVRVFPKVLLTGLSIAGVVYIGVAIVAVALVPIGTLEASDTPLVEVVKAGAPGLPIEQILPFISMFAVSNTALINMLMASRLIYGMSRQHVLPRHLGVVHPVRRSPWVAIVFTTSIAFGLIFYVTAFANSTAIAVLGGTTSLLLLAVFAMVNVAVLVLRRDVREGRAKASEPPGERGRADQPVHFRTPTLFPIIGCLASLYLVTPLSGRPVQQYVLSGVLIAIGIVLFFITMAFNRQLGIKGAAITDLTHLGDAPD